MGMYTNPTNGGGVWRLFRAFGVLTIASLLASCRVALGEPPSPAALPFAARLAGRRPVARTVKPDAH